MPAELIEALPKLELTIESFDAGLEKYAATWWQTNQVFCRTAQMTPEMVKTMAEAGCRVIQYGAQIRVASHSIRLAGYGLDKGDVAKDDEASRNRRSQALLKPHFHWRF